MDEKTLANTIAKLLDEMVIPKIETNLVAIVEQVERYNTLHAQILDIKQVMLFNRTVSDKQRAQVNDRLDRLEAELADIKKIIAGGVNG